MATKKAVSAAKKTSVKKTNSRSKVSTVKAVSSSRGSNLFSVGLNRSPFVGALIAEFIGTFLLVASIIAVQGQPLFVAFALVGIVLVVGGLSGAHVNPALTVGAWVTGKMKSLRAVGYIVAQVLGAILAFVVLNAFLKGSESATAASAPALYHAASITSGKEWYVFFAELLGTTILALGFASALRDKRDKIVSAFTYGMALLIGLLIAGSITALFLTVQNTGLTFLNPAVAIATNGLAWSVWPIAIYILAPFVGGIIGFILLDLLRAESDGGNDKK